MKKCVAALMAAIVAVSAFSAVCYAEPADSTGNDGNSSAVQQLDLSSNNENSYYNYLQSNSGVKDAEKDIFISADSYTANDGAVVSDSMEYTDENGVTKSGVIKWEREKGSLTYTVNVSEDGMYALGLSYCPIAGRGLPLSFSFKIDGEQPYETLSSVNFERTWVDENIDGVQDGNGNVYASEQLEKFLFKNTMAMDRTGQYIDPLKVHLTAGTHTVTVTAASGELYFAGVLLCAPEQVKPYSEVAAGYKSAGYTNYDGDEIIIEGEKAKYKSSSSITPFIDNSDPSINPSQAFKDIINYIGSTGWQTPNETIVWDVEVPKDGLYKLGFRFRQQNVINGNSYRSLKIDGKSPFEQAKEISFYYDGGWQFQGLTADGEQALIYLTAGKHELSLTVTLGEFGEISREINDITYELGNLYLKIRMITGENIDTGRSYVFFEQIPNFNETLENNIKRLSDLCDQITEITGQDSGTYISTIKNMIRVMEDIYDNPYTAQKYISTYYDNYCSVSALVADIAKLPLDIDQMILASPDKEYTKKMAGFWSKLKYSFERFLVSFMSDYRYSAKDTDGKTTLTLWVTWGRDQTQVLTSLVRDSFEKEHPDVHVNIQIVGASLVQAILSGSGPDLLLGQARTEPVNYGMRGALLDLKQFDDWEDVLTRYQDSAADPYMLGDALYGIPDTQSFNILYYRTDIFEQMGLTVPKTWTEFRNTTALLQRQNLAVGMPGPGELYYFATLLEQNGASLYAPDLKSTAVSDGKAVETFVFWTDFYTNLGYSTAYSFYNRFRAGTMPMGVSLYSDYVLFSEAAPEITGKWAIAPMPGTEQEDGTINYTQADTGTACVIPKISKHPELGWEFIKWWTSDNTQYRYSNMVEAILGEVGRVQTANVEALKKLAWQSNDLDVILETWQHVNGLEEVPGGYYVQRSIYQAFWNVVNLSENPKDMIVKWGKVADQEITRKRGEYNLD